MTAHPFTTEALAATQAARIAGECPGCARLARTGFPAQCNHCRRTAPDSLTIAQTQALAAYLAAHATTEI